MRWAPSSGSSGPLGFQVDDYHLRRAGLDYWQHLAWEVVDDWAALTAALPASRHWYFTKRGDTHYTEIGFHEGDVLVFGSESQGLPGRNPRRRRGPTPANPHAAGGPEPEPVEFGRGRGVRSAPPMGRVAPAAALSARARIASNRAFEPTSYHQPDHYGTCNRL